MYTQRLTPQQHTPADPAIQQAARALRQGQLVAFPTETVYGLGADATSAQAVAQIYQAKQRPADNPLIVHVAAIQQVAHWAVLDGRVRHLLEHCWPGPLTVVLKARQPALAATRGRDTLALRMPKHPLALALLEACGVPVAAPSANLSGRPSPTTADHVWADLSGRIHWLVDGGPCGVGIESTVVDLSDEVPRILRPGDISASELAAVLGVEVLEIPEEVAAQRSPGTRYRHYQPRIPVALLEPAVDVQCLGAWVALCQQYWSERPLAVLAPPAQHLAGVVFRGITDAGMLQAQLYALLRELEQEAVGLILVQAVDPQAAVMERLRRAASVVLQGHPQVEALVPLLGPILRSGY